MSDRARRPLPAYRDLRAWDVRGVDGTLVTTVTDLAAVLGMPVPDAAEWVRARADDRPMPAELVAEARRLR
ncbi:hypothetical protein [Prescottella subtropica]|uniref:hypothetical protein n=1 Tax=Prescottella subtropica TaxID=2545757 RepID=UPI0010F7F82D|nr:hypothetical protein [Prescottella subtropica]